MDKRQIYLIIAVAVVLLFIVEPFAIGMLSSGGSQQSSQQGTAETADYSGAVQANVTISKYGPYLIVKGGNAGAVEGIKARLADEGIADYAVPSQSGDLIVSLKSSSYAVRAAREFEKANATVFASVSMSTPPQLVADDGTLINTDGAVFNMQVRPLFEEGSKAPATFTAFVEGGVLSGIGNFAFLPSAVNGFVVEADVLPSNEGEYAIEVDWEKRTAAKPFAANYSAAYKEKSFILVSGNATSGQLSAAAGRDYVTFTQPGIISVRNDFSDLQRAQDELSALGLEVSFPPSRIILSNQTSNATSQSLLEALSSAGIPASLSTERTLRVRLPEVMESEGATYYSNGEIVEIGKTEGIYGPNATSIPVSVDFEATGSFVTRIISVSEATSGG